MKQNNVISVFFLAILFSLVVLEAADKSPTPTPGKQSLADYAKKKKLKADSKVISDENIQELSSKGSFVTPDDNSETNSKPRAQQETDSWSNRKFQTIDEWMAQRKAQGKKSRVSYSLSDLREMSGVDSIPETRQLVRDLVDRYAAEVRQRADLFFKSEWTITDYKDAWGKQIIAGVEEGVVYFSSGGPDENQQTVGDNVIGKFVIDPAVVPRKSFNWDTSSPE